MGILLIPFLFWYFYLEALHDHYVWVDVKNHSDNLSPERKAWHFISVLQAGTILGLLCIIATFDLQITMDLWRLVAWFVFIRWIMLDNVQNRLRGESFLYVEKENFVGGKIHWLADKLHFPAEILALLLKLILLALIIIL